MDNYDLPKAPQYRLKAPADFTERIIQRIQEERLQFITPLDALKRISGIAAMLVLCIGLGVGIGSGLGKTLTSSDRDYQLQDFQNSHHLSPPAASTYLIFEL